MKTYENIKVFAILKPALFTWDLEPMQEFDTCRSAENVLQLPTEPAKTLAFCKEHFQHLCRFVNAQSVSSRAAQGFSVDKEVTVEVKASTSEAVICVSS